MNGQISISVRLWVSRSAPVGVSALPYIHFMATKRRRRSIKLLICPGCEEEGTLRKILYGMPDPETFDFEKYEVGGCVMNGDGSDPDIACRECAWEGMRDALSGA